MTGSTIALGSAVCVVSAVLISSGLTKLTAPGLARAALIELAPGLRRSAGPLLRGISLVEAGTGAGMLPSSTRTVACALAILLGSGFAAVGAWGWLRRSSLPCGCFGRATGPPLGLRNVAVGAALSVVAGLAGWLTQLGIPADAGRLCPPTAAAICLLTTALRRDMVKDLIRPVRANTDLATGDLR